MVTDAHHGSASSPALLFFLLPGFKPHSPDRDCFHGGDNVSTRKSTTLCDSKLHQPQLSPLHATVGHRRRHHHHRQENSQTICVSPAPCQFLTDYIPPSIRPSLPLSKPSTHPNSSRNAPSDDKPAPGSQPKRQPTETVALNLLRGLLKSVSTCTYVSTSD